MCVIVGLVLGLMPVEQARETVAGYAATVAYRSSGRPGAGHRRDGGLSPRRTGSAVP